MNHSESTKLKWQDPQYRQNHLDANRRSWTPERRERQRLIALKLWALPEFRAKRLKYAKQIIIKNCEYCGKQYEAYGIKSQFCSMQCSGKGKTRGDNKGFMGHIHTEKSKKKTSLSMKKHHLENPEHKKRWFGASAKKPNQLETRFARFLRNNNFDFDYVGNGKKWIGNYCPDFINENKHLLIELFGDYWHRQDKFDETNERLETFIRAGYKPLIIWQHQFESYPELLLADIGNWYKSISNLQCVVEIIPKKWGEERILANNSLYCGKLLILNAGGQSSIHYHKTKSEHLCIYKGEVSFMLENKIEKLRPLNIIEVKPHQRHSFMGIQKSMIIEISTPHVESDVVRLSESKAYVEDEDV